MTDYAAKYDRVAEKFAEHSYANLHFDMRRRFIIATTWGPPLQPGDSVLELGCGDGYLAQLFVQYGFHYHGVDISPKMIEMAEGRLREAGLTTNFTFQITKVSQMPISESYDAIISYMGTFFSYTPDPWAVLQQVRPYVRKKLIIDFNPRRDILVQDALATLRTVGFSRVTWRPFFVPKEKCLPLWSLAALAFYERVPLIRKVPLCWKFNCLLKAEP